MTKLEVLNFESTWEITNYRRFMNQFPHQKLTKLNEALSSNKFIRKWVVYVFHVKMGVHQTKIENNLLRNMWSVWRAFLGVVCSFGLRGLKKLGTWNKVDTWW